MQIHYVSFYGCLVLQPLLVPQKAFFHYLLYQLGEEVGQSKHRSELFCDLSTSETCRIGVISCLQSLYVLCSWVLHPYSACFMWALWTYWVSHQYDQISDWRMSFSSRDPNSNLKSVIEGVRGTRVLDAFLSDSDTASLVSWPSHQERKWPWLFSCHHVPRGTIRGLITEKLSSGHDCWLYNFSLSRWR